MGQHSAPRARPARTAAEARFRLIRSLSPRLTPTQVVITVMFALVGFATTSAFTGNGTNGVLANARQSDLVSVLDDLASRQARLQAEYDRLENSRQTLLGGDQYQALNEAKRRAEALRVLAGSEPLIGSGITVTISGNLSATTLLDAIQELRDGGATSIQVADRDLAVRIVANSWFADSANGVTVSGTALQVPIVISAIGDSDVLEPALKIPGGLQDTVGAGGGTVSVVASQDIEILAVVPLPKS